MVSSMLFGVRVKQDSGLTNWIKGQRTKEEINALMTAAANGPLKGIMDVNNEPLVSSDFNHTTVSSTFDATQTRVIKGEDGSVLVKVLAWYDNEWGYSCRMLDAARAWMAAK